MQPNRHRPQSNTNGPAFTVQDEIRRDRHLRRMAKMQKKRRAVSRFTTVMLCLIVGVLLLCAVGVAVTRIQNVTLLGNDRYGEEEILSAADFNRLSALLFLRPASLEKKILSACPYVEAVHIEKTYPNSLTITVVETKAVYALELHGSVWLLDRDLRAVDTDKPTEALTVLTLPTVRRIYTGNTIEFADQDNDAFVRTVLEELIGDENPLCLGTLTLTDRYHIEGITADRTCKIVFGDRRDLAQKAVLAAKLMADAKADASEKTLIDVSSLSGPSVTQDFSGAF